MIQSRLPQVLRTLPANVWRGHGVLLSLPYMFFLKQVRAFSMTEIGYEQPMDQGKSSRSTFEVTGGCKRAGPGCWHPVD